LPLVTPTSQIVGTQAVMNVLAGERYKTITNEVKRYLLGHYGAAPAPVNEQLRKNAVGNEEVIDVRPADLIPNELHKLREQIGALAKSEEDVLTFAMFPDIGRTFLQERNDGTLKPEALEPERRKNKEIAAGATTATEFVIDVHGESYQVAITGVGVKGTSKRHFYLTLDGVPQEVVFESLNEYQAESKTGRKQATKEGHVTTNMPGNIVAVLVKEGDVVTAGQPVLVTEAMKMEAEVQAPIGGKVVGIFVAKGDRVTPGEVLIEIEKA
jgi:pyruvate carboxylase subunit B